MAGEDQSTCGKGIAANAVLPAKLAEMMDALAEVLARHVRALDLSDPNSRTEHDAYVRLVRGHRGIARELASLAEQMAGCHEIPMGRHDMEVMADPDGQAAAFRRFVSLERDFGEFLMARAASDEKLLAQ